MKNKINIAELLKDCPKGMELDCPIYDNLYFDHIREHPIYPIICWTVDSKGNEHEVSFNWYGKSSSIDCAKCVIFPKGKTTWEGFIPTCKFKDGDIIYIKSKSISNTELVGIYKKEDSELIYDYCSVSLNSKSFYHDNMGLINKNIIDISRLATEEEKTKLFQAIKSNGYDWNAETKTLEKLIKPEFKIGDRIRHKTNTGQENVVTEIKDTHYILDDESALPFISQDQYIIIPNKFDITTLKSFESRVLVRHNKDNKWCGSFFSFIDGDHHSYCYKFVTTAGKSYPMMIPYKGNEWLLGKTDNCDEYYKNW